MKDALYENNIHNNMLISIDDLINQMHRDDLVIIDCRFDLINKTYGRDSYLQGHIPGAIFLNVENELSSKVKKHGGRHPLPNVEYIHHLLESRGISIDSEIIIYDDGDLAGACRARLILKFLGFKNIRILDGGFNLYLKKCSLVSTYEPTFLSKSFDIEINNNIFVDMDYIKSKINNKNTIIVDCREPNRYKGTIEPIDIKKGHIPSSVNYFWKDLLSEPTGLFKTRDELLNYFKDLKEFDEIIIYCGSGITASVTSLALDIINIKHKVYAGGFSDWVSYKDNEVFVIN